MAHQIDKEKAEDIALKEEVDEELRQKNEDMRQRLDKEKALVENSKNNEAELRSQCSELIQERKELQEQLGGQKRLNTEVYEGLQNLVSEKYNENILTQLAWPKGDLDGVTSLYEISVEAVRKTNEQLQGPIYKMLLAEYMKKHQRQRVTRMMRKRKIRTRKMIRRAAKMEAIMMRNGTMMMIKGGGDQKKDDVLEEDFGDDDEPPLPKFVMKERRIKRRNEKSYAGSSKKHNADVEASPSLQDALTGHAEHEYFMITAEKVLQNHTLKTWQKLTIRQLGKKWALVARLKKHIKISTQNAHFNACKDKGKAIEVHPISYPPAKASGGTLLWSHQRNTSRTTRHLADKGVGA